VVKGRDLLQRAVVLIVEELQQLEILHQPEVAEEEIQVRMVILAELAVVVL
tara:strand:- start:444 stop:596 length:153 start_codon:yes stop_codon:yes gene_type:complete